MHTCDEELLVIELQSGDKSSLSGTIWSWSAFLYKVLNAIVR